ncbi:YraN family protein [Corynebacterium heidelbergense]|uniref:UPF0102 protein DLJ54_03640 n=1 Tax=Corynebacterium heidelbergense TaxID=2055947 RepID=A0A364V6W1_9CORY|nr:YraN family protein [Corynebacterium heidelbergense]RAV32382.1 YraN family protein [Corynebacterium heidelbergense]
MGDTRETGRRGEAQARHYLEQRGYAVLGQNWHSRFGELDLIARSAAGMVVFVEVKYRASQWAGGGLAAVTAAKLRKMRLAAALWLRENPAEGERDVRFDVIDVGPDGVRHHVEGVW